MGRGIEVKILLPPPKKKVIEGERHELLCTMAEGLGQMNLGILSIRSWPSSE